MAAMILDMAANALCTVMMLRMLGRRVRALRILLSAFLGAFAAQGIRLLHFSGGQAVLCWLPIALAMASAATGRVSMRAALTLLACMGLLGGTVYALYGALGTPGRAWCAGACFALIMSFRLSRARRMAQDMCTVCICIRHEGYTAKMEALVDSGNCLRDYLTHRPVIVLPEAARETLGLSEMPMRPIFADTAGGRQMMACFTPQSVTVIDGRQSVPAAACVAFSEGLSPGAPALLPPSLLAERTIRDESRLDWEGNVHGKAES